MIEMMPLFRKRTRTWKGTRKGVDETHHSIIAVSVYPSLINSWAWSTTSDCNRTNTSRKWFPPPPPVPTALHVGTPPRRQRVTYILQKIWSSFFSVHVEKREQINLFGVCSVVWNKYFVYGVFLSFFIPYPKVEVWILFVYLQVYLFTFFHRNYLKLVKEFLKKIKLGIRN